MDRRQKWSALADQIFGLVYLSEPEPVSEKVMAALPAPVPVEVVEARPTKFSAKLSARKKTPKPRKAPAEAKEKPREPGAKPTAREVVLAALKAAGRPLTVKEIVTVAEDTCKMDLSGFRDIRAAIGFQVPRMDLNGEIVLADVSRNAKSYALPGHEKF